MGAGLVVGINAFSDSYSSDRTHESKGYKEDFGERHGAEIKGFEKEELV